MMTGPCRVVVLGLSLSSSWGNGHATTYRALLRALADRGHDILFLEREQPWYAANRDLRTPGFCRLAFYRSLEGLAAWHDEIAEADVVIVGSYVPQGTAVCRLVRRLARGVAAFYDIDTPVTLAKLAAGDCEYLSPELIPALDLYLTFTGGPVLEELERRYRAPAARALYCSVDPAAYPVTVTARRWDVGFLGTYSADRQPALERLLIEPARRDPTLRCVVAGAQYPEDIDWPANVTRIEHLSPAEHPAFYGSLGWALNVTRQDMVRAGYSPSVRLFEAAACGAPILTDAWPGLGDVFEDGRDLLVVHGADDVLAAVRRDDRSRRTIALGGRRRVLAAHTASHRARELEHHVAEAQVARADQRLPLAPA